MRILIFAMMLVFSGALLQSDAQTVPIKNLGPAVAVAKERVEATAFARPLSNGNVFVVSRGRVLLLDSALALVKVVADSTAFAPGRRPVQFVTVIPFVADSLLLIDYNATAFLVVDPDGKIVRPVAAPKSNDMTNLISSAGLRSDSRGRLIYRGVFPGKFAPGISSAIVDSFPIVRANFETRLVDTLAVITVSTGYGRTTTTVENNRLTTRTIQQPLPTTDGWVALPDGSIAIVRGRDYHVDWINADGSKTSTPKLPFDWRRITDEEKVRIIDSLAKAEANRRVLRDSLVRTGQIVYPPGIPMLMTEFVPATELPDYYPPVRDGTTQVDPDGNVWILPNTSSSARGGLLYDVVNRKGEFFRVQLPPTCALSGLGSNGAVFLVCGGSRLERRRVEN